MFSLYRNPDLGDRIFDCLRTSMAAVQAEDVHASFLFVGDLHGHHKEWLGSTTTNHGVAAFDFATVSGCDQLVVGPTHACGGTLDLLMTDAPDLVQCGDRTFHIHSCCVPCTISTDVGINIHVHVYSIHNVCKQSMHLLFYY